MSQTVSGWWSSLTGKNNGSGSNMGYDSGSNMGYDSGSNMGSGMGSGMGSNMGYGMGSNMGYGGRKRRRTMKRGGMPLHNSPGVFENQSPYPQAVGEKRGGSPVPYSPRIFGDQSPFPQAVGGKRRKTRRMRKMRK